MKCVQEFDLKFFSTYSDAVLDQNYCLKTIEVENNVLPQSINIGINGVFKDFRLKPFKRISKNGSFYIENVFIQISP